MKLNPKKGVTLGCNVVVINHLRSLHLHSLADEFQADRRIPSSIVDRFKSLTLDRIINFLNKKSALGLGKNSGTLSVEPTKNKRFGGSKSQIKQSDKPSDKTSNQPFNELSNQLKLKIRDMSEAKYRHSQEFRNHNPCDQIVTTKQMRVEPTKPRHDQDVASTFQSGLSKTGHQKEKENGHVEHSQECEKSESPKFAIKKDKRSDNKKAKSQGGSNGRLDLSQDLEEMCDQVVMTYLEDHGFQDTLEDFQATKNNSVESSERKNITLEKLLETIASHPIKKCTKVNSSPKSKTNQSEVTSVDCQTLPKVKTCSKEGNFRVGKWTKDEYEIFMNVAFGQTTAPENEGIAQINALPYFVISEVGHKLQRASHLVYMHWTVHIRPILLDYHNGNIHSNWRRKFLRYLVGKKVQSTKCIDWNDAKRNFPGKSTNTFTNTFRNFRPEKQDCRPFYLIIKDYLKKTKNNKKQDCYKKMREEIVRLYDEARGVL